MLQITILQSHLCLLALRDVTDDGSYAKGLIRLVFQGKDGQIGIEGTGVSFHYEDIYAVNDYAFGPEPKYAVSELGLIPYVSKYINEDFRAYTLIPVFISRCEQRFDDPANVADFLENVGFMLADDVDDLGNASSGVGLSVY